MAQRAPNADSGRFALCALRPRLIRKEIATMTHRVRWKGVGRVAVAAAAMLFAIYAPAAARQDGQVTPRDLERAGGARMPDGHGLGWMPSTQNELARSPRFRIAPLTRGERPSRLVLTEFLPPVGDQMHEGSCVGWSSGYYSYTYG